MLQQTQVVTVIDYFRRFIKRFPTVRQLAEADPAEVLKIWEGLGYYRRARQMHMAAKKIVDEHGGKFPSTFDQVLALPGIGRYTAGAILSIADDRPLPVVEGNTIRVYSRLMNFQQDVKDSNGQKVLWGFAESLVTSHRPGDLNQALMELGSKICTVKSPACTSCPVSSHCLALLNGDPIQLPNKGNTKTKYEDLHQAAVVIERKGRYVVRLCGPDEHWTGLWDFPRVTIPKGRDKTELVRQIVDRVQKQTGLTVFVDHPFTKIKHAVTRFRISLGCYQANDVTGRLKSSRNLQWVSIEELSKLPMNVTGRKIADHLEKSRS